MSRPKGEREIVVSVVVVRGATWYTQGGDWAEEKIRSFGRYEKEISMGREGKRTEGVWIGLLFVGLAKRPWREGRFRSADWAMFCGAKIALWLSLFTSNEEKQGAI